MSAADWRASGPNGLVPPELHEQFRRASRNVCAVCGERFPNPNSRGWIEHMRYHTVPVECVCPDLPPLRPNGECTGCRRPRIDPSRLDHLRRVSALS